MIEQEDAETVVVEAKSIIEKLMTIKDNPKIDFDTLCIKYILS